MLRWKRGFWKDLLFQPPQLHEFPSAEIQVVEKSVRATRSSQLQPDQHESARAFLHRDRERQRHEKRVRLVLCNPSIDAHNLDLK